MLEICLLSIDLRVCRSHNVNIGVVQWLSQAYSRVVSNFLGAGTCTVRRHALFRMQTIADDSVSLQQAHCWFPVLAIPNDKI